jgi:chitinase
MQLSHTNDSATFQVSTVCVPHAPTAVMTPSSQGAGSTLPATRSYTVTVTNQDGSACGGSAFSLVGSAPSTWSSSISPSQVTLAPGASATASLSVTAPSGTSAGSYPVAGGTGSDLSHAAATASGSFWIDNLAPAAPADLKATVRANKVTLSWTAATDSGGSGIARYGVRRGSTQVGTPASTTYTDAPGNGTWSYTVVAMDNAGNISAPSASVSATIGRK